MPPIFSECVGLKFALTIALVVTLVESVSLIWVMKMTMNMTTKIATLGGTVIVGDKLSPSSMLQGQFTGRNSSAFDGKGGSNPPPHLLFNFKIEGVAWSA